MAGIFIEERIVRGDMYGSGYALWHILGLRATIGIVSSAIKYWDWTHTRTLTDCELRLLVLLYLIVNSLLLEVDFTEASIYRSSLHDGPV